MSFLSMGTLEILAILLVAFIVLGPERMMDAARLLGKAVREARRLTESMPRLTLDELSDTPEGPDPGAEASSDATASDHASADDGPVMFQPGQASEAGAHSEESRQEKA